jgi:hypothetical protein
VRAIFRCITTKARAHAELAVRDERGPFVVLNIRAMNVAVNKAANGVAHTRGTVRVELTTVVTIWNVDLREVTSASDLNVSGSLGEVNT